MTAPPEPRLALWLVSHLAPADWRESLAGDLIEEHRRRYTAGRPAGPFWALWAALVICLRLALDRRQGGFAAEPSSPRRVSELPIAFRQTRRALLAHRAYAATAVLIIALGIGATATAFSLANVLFFRPIPGVAAPTRLVTMFFGATGGGTFYTSMPDFDVLAPATPAFAALAGGGHVAANLGREGVAKRIDLGVVSGNYFDVLGQAIGAGRGFTVKEGRNPSAEPTVVLSDALWREAFAATPLVGRSVTINGASYTVIGIGRRGFTGLSRTEHRDAWVPVAQYMRLYPDSKSVFATRIPVFDTLTGRLAPGATAAQAAAQAEVVRARLAAARPKDMQFAHGHYLVRPGVVERDWVFGELSRSMAIVGSLVGLLLLLTCANVANLMLMRATSRRAELATCAALGASRGGLMRLLMLESVALAAVGGLTGLGLCVLANRALVGVVVLRGVSPLGRAPLDWRVFTVAAALSGFVAVAAGVFPALVGSRADLLGAIRDVTRSPTGRRRAATVMAAAQVAISLTLLVGASLLTHSMVMRRAIDVGFEPSRVLALSVDPGLQYQERSAMTAFYRDVLDRIRALPGARVAGIAQLEPMGRNQFGNSVTAEGQPAASHINVEANRFTPGVLESLGLPLVDGRDFTDDEIFEPVAGDGPVIINASLARKLFGTTTAAGRRVVLGTPAEARVVVGVTRDLRQFDALDPPQDALFEAFRPDTIGWSTVLIGLTRASDAQPMAAAAARAVRDVDRSMPIYDVRTLDEDVAQQYASEALIATLSQVFAALATLLAAVGLYGVLSRGVAERRREFGIRMALGARPASVARLVAGDASRVLLAGTVVGAGASVLLAYLLEHQLFGVRPYDPVAALTALTLLIAVTAAATQPAVRRATHVDPADTLRE